MRLSRLRIQNFRNFREVNCALDRHVVLLGENGAGKSNLLYALRLLLDSALPDANRYLDAEDFWDGGSAFGGTEIVVSVDLTEYADEPGVLACLADYEVAPPVGWPHSVARLTFRFAPRDTGEAESRASTKKEDYDFAIYGGDERSNVVARDVRRYLGFRVLNALRDAEGDLRAWKRSPLRPLLEEVRDKLDEQALARVCKDVDTATNTLTAEKPLVELRTELETRLQKMLGLQHELSPRFGFNSTDPRQLLQSLRLFLDANRRREVADTSLGLANVLYLSLLLLHTAQQEKSLKTAATILGIEEPEAHLHPQMQRVVFRDLLRSERPVLVSTHSPNIASVASVDSLVVLRVVQGESKLASFAEAPGFSVEEKADLQRYLDVTRGEMVFGRGVILVEGDAEKFVVPAAASLLATPVDLDAFGITICSVAGTDFEPYAKFLKALEIAFVVITDGDARDASSASPPGIKRATSLLEALGEDTAAKDVHAMVATGAVDAGRTILEGMGIFVGARTLETDLVSSGAGPRMRAAFKAVFPTSRDTTADPFDREGALADADEDAIIALAERAGKGRFAQSFAARMKTSDVPPYVQKAIEAIVVKCRRV